MNTAESAGTKGSVAAGMGLGRHQDQPRTLCRLSVRRATKGVQDPDDGGVSSEHAQTHRSDHGEAENQRHEKRIHVSNHPCSSQPDEVQYQMPSLPVPYT